MLPFFYAGHAVCEHAGRQLVHRQPDSGGGYQQQPPAPVSDPQAISDRRELLATSLRSAAPASGQHTAAGGGATWASG